MAAGWSQDYKSEATHNQFDSSVYSNLVMPVVAKRESYFSGEPKKREPSRKRERTKTRKKTK